jgi:hypothetical protein
MYQDRHELTGSSFLAQKVCDRMLGLKENCIHPTSQKLYIKSCIGGIDNSIEGIQVRR